MGGSDRLGVELHAVPAAVGRFARHRGSVARPRGNVERRRLGDDQRVVAHGLEPRRHAVEERGSVVGDRLDDAVRGAVGAVDASAERDGHLLESEAHTEHGHGGAPQDLQPPPRVGGAVWGPRARAEHDVRVAVEHVEVDGVALHEVRARARRLPQQLFDAARVRIVVVDEEHARGGGSRRHPPILPIRGGQFCPVPAQHTDIQRDACGVGGVMP